jgi:hypothetical protein
MACQDDPLPPLEALPRRTPPTIPRPRAQCATGSSSSRDFLTRIGHLPDVAEQRLATMRPRSQPAAVLP